MKKTTYLLLATTIFVVVFASACGGSAAPATQAAPPVDVPTQSAPEAAPVDAVAPTTAPAQTFAPACQAAASCAAPAVTDTVASDTFCVEKVPYQNISVEPGTTFESLDTSGELKCQDSGTVVDGKSVITCSGKELWTYELKFTNSACAAGALTTGTGQCQDGLGYDAAQNCCAPLTGGDAGSTIIKVNIGACPLPHN
ncbi:MAG: hypothetical protein IPL71_15600 [Anaerolineales bacterium]|uniref:hypothetical protein n=1 Tax=Candidatus Villigracilis proximus TaxID=3140683 RepID=UPI003136A1CE|nr:hypothetical protein [Anaerolineales bacterium]